MNKGKCDPRDRRRRGRSVVTPLPTARFTFCEDRNVQTKIGVARVNTQEETPAAEDIGVVPFASRSLTFDGELFWSNHRAKDTIISFALPK